MISAFSLDVIALMPKHNYLTRISAILLMIKKIPVIYILKVFRR
jgi:hypothetical protein